MKLVIKRKDVNFVKTKRYKPILAVGTFLLSVRKTKNFFIKSQFHFKKNKLMI